ncbi:hypothetical protein [Halodesulfovibrio aestuarii]|uniref:Uncharacterized protein n=1 Tax=Halodesulfovibrio aestuarii TaxID=126333 RepID=A0A8G2F7S8_9BACT|nr:hypothetical protein [Halodesulfovibrio aestuarii]SHI52574.1 hypothetical protein SAMN05660830_00209 [Halodesulfovibrio aestuarii]
MEALFQGKLDNFCALYAVLNAMQRTHGINHWEARKLFHAGLLSFSRDAESWENIVCNRTDYIAEVQSFINLIRSEGTSIHYTQPFPDGKASIADVLKVVKAWSPVEQGKGTSLYEKAGGKGVVLQFKRFLPFRGAPLITHWTAVKEFVGSEIRFIDSSLEKNATYALPQNGFCTREDELKQSQLFMVNPATIFLLEARD